MHCLRQRPYALAVALLLMSNKTLVPLMRLVEEIPADHPVSIHQLEIKTGMCFRTILRYIETIERIQRSAKVVRQPVGMRLMVKKEG